MRLDTDDSIVAVAGGADANLAWTGRGTQSSHKVDGSRTPTIDSVAVTSTPMLASDTYGEGEDIEFTVTFNVAVEVAGDPVFRFALGDTGAGRDVDAAYASGSGTTALVFSYTVVSSDSDNNGIFLYDGVDLNNPDGPVRLDTDDSIVAVAGGADANLAWTGRGTQSSHKVDGSRTPGICDRTEKIQEVILAEISGVDDCAAVTVANLASITTFGGLGTGTISQGISSLKKGDFAGLTSLTVLNLSRNTLTSLPEGIFAGLAALTNLDLANNQLTSLPEGVFSELVTLELISLGGTLSPSYGPGSSPA